MSDRINELEAKLTATRKHNLDLIKASDKLRYALEEIAFFDAAERLKFHNEMMGRFPVMMNIEQIKEVFENLGLRVVGSELEEDVWGDEVLKVHPHIMDLYNYDGDPIRKLSRAAIGYRVAYDSEHNAFLFKEKE